MSSDTGDGLAERASTWFPERPESVSAARLYTTSLLKEWGATRQLAEASLIVSELATNAIRHAHSGFELNISRVDDTVRIAVSDESPRVPVVQNLQPGSVSGFGLRLVDEIASQWGYEVGVDGKKVWALLAGA